MRYIITRIKEDGSKDYMYRAFPITKWIADKQLAMRMDEFAVQAKSHHLNSIKVNHIIEAVEI